MGLLDTIQSDIKDITTNLNDFSRSATFLAPDESTATVGVLHSKHRINVDQDGVPINEKNIHVSVSESALTAVSYPVRNASDEVDFLNHRVTVKDSTNTSVTYKIVEWWPDETIGLITLRCQDYA